MESLAHASHPNLLDIPIIQQNFKGPRPENDHFVETSEIGTDTMTQETKACIVNHQTNHNHQCACAIEKIQNGTYGICENCGKPINPERLDFLPEATHCVSCQANLEKH